MNKLMGLSEVSLLRQIISGSLERNIDLEIYKNPLIYLEDKSVSKDIYTLLPFNTLNVNLDSFIHYPSLNIDYSMGDLILLPLISNNIYTYQQYIEYLQLFNYSNNILFKEKDIGWLYISKSLDFLYGEVFFKQYIIDKYIYNLRTIHLKDEGIIKDRELFIVSVESDSKENKISLLFDHIFNLIDSIYIERVTLLNDGHKLYKLSNHNYLYIIPNYYLSFCNKDLVSDLVK